MPDRTKYSLTWSQMEHLEALRAAAAFDRASGVTSNDSRVVGFLNGGVIGILVDKGFALRASRTRARRRETICWLTESGRLKAEELREHQPL